MEEEQEAMRRSNYFLQINPKGMQCVRICDYTSVCVTMALYG